MTISNFKDSCMIQNYHSLMVEFESRWVFLWFDWKLFFCVCGVCVCVCVCVLLLFFHPLPL